MVSKIKERAGKKELANDKPKQPVKTVTRGDVMQATRQKCNQLIVQAKRQSYHKGEIIGQFFFSLFLLRLCQLP